MISLLFLFSFLKALEPLQTKLKDEESLPNLLVVGIALIGLGLLIANTALVAWFIIRKRIKGKKSETKTIHSTQHEKLLFFAAPSFFFHFFIFLILLFARRLFVMFNLISFFCSYNSLMLVSICWTPRSFFYPSTISSYSLAQMTISSNLFYFLFSSSFCEWYSLILIVINF